MIYLKSVVNNFYSEPRHNRRYLGVSHKSLLTSRIKNWFGSCGRDWDRYEETRMSDDCPCPRIFQGNFSRESYVRLRSPKIVSVFKSESEVNIFHQSESMFGSIPKLIFLVPIDQLINSILLKRNYRSQKN